MADATGRDLRDEVWTSRDLVLAEGIAPLVVPLTAPDRGYRACLDKARDLASGGRECFFRLRFVSRRLRFNRD